MKSSNRAAELEASIESVHDMQSDGQVWSFESTGIRAREVCTVCGLIHETARNGQNSGGYSRWFSFHGNPLSLAQAATVGCGASVPEQAKSPVLYCLVYQGGLCNLFKVGPEHSWQRIKQSGYVSCEDVARGLVMAGVDVAVAWCNEAGDIARSAWRFSDFEQAPFGIHERAFVLERVRYANSQELASKGGVL